MKQFCDEAEEHPDLVQMVDSDNDESSENDSGDGGEETSNVAHVSVYTDNATEILLIILT